MVINPKFAFKVSVRYQPAKWELVCLAMFSKLKYVVRTPPSV